MKKLFGLITICSVLAFPVLAAKPVNISDRVNQPVPATNIELVKKVFSEDIEGIRGKDKPASPSGQDKKNGSKEKYTATGVLGPLATGAKYAVVIGICDYPGTDYDLCESDGDSLHMYKALIDLYGYKAENIRLFKDMGGTTGPNLNNASYATPTRDSIINAIQEIKELATSPDDEVVFFFSGHGAKGNADDGDAEDTDEAIVVHDSDRAMDADGYSDLDFIWDGELRSWFDGFGTTRIAFVFDTCRAGGMNDVATDVNGVVIEGRVISMATGETQSAYVYSKAGEDVDGDGIDDGEGVFTRLFANEGMLQGLADGYNQLETTDDKVAVEEAFDYAKKNIPRSLKGRQKPVISDNFTNDLLL